MSTVELEADVKEVPERWLEGRRLRDGDVLVVKVKGDGEKPFSGCDEPDLVTRRRRAVREAAGAWADRTDKEIEAWQKDMREGWSRRFDRPFPDAE